MNQLPPTCFRTACTVSGADFAREPQARRWVLLSVLALGLALSPAWADVPAQRYRARMPSVAVLYDRRDEYTPHAFGEIIAGIESHPNVAVVHLAIADTYAVLPSTQAGGGGGFLKVASYSGANIAVLYPDIGEPYRSVFTKIIEGIEDKTKVRVASYAIGSNQNAAELNAELKRQNVRVVIALGKNGLKAAHAIDHSNINIVAGGVLAVPENEARGIAVHSLAPDPELLFSRLKVLVPQAKRVHVVYDPHQNAWLVALARPAAKALGLELVLHEAADLKTAIQQYQAIFANAEARDALWLPQDSTTVEESTVLPLVLQEAWNRNVTVFSSSLAHVKRGILFSLYPNNLELGRNLANSALGQLASNTEPAPGVTPLKDVLLAVNLRTASHLGLNINNKQGFDLVFPEP